MSNDLYHFGIPGMRWGIRRFRASDGTYTAAGRARYHQAKAEYKSAKKSGDYVKAGVAKRKVEEAYRDFKKGKVMDKGAKLYKKGLVVDNLDRKVGVARKVQKALLTVGGLGAAYAYKKTGSYKHVAMVGSAAAGAALVAEVMKRHYANRARSMRTYWNNRSEQNKKAKGD